LLWAAFVKTQAEDPTPRFLEAFYFDDNEQSANSLARLVLKGQKRAAAALLWSYEHDKRRIPQPGHLSIVTESFRIAVPSITAMPKIEIW
jgi:uncharacterized protein YhfF